MTYREIDGQHDIRAWPIPRSNTRWCATIADTQTKAILATGDGMSRDAAIADARGNLLPTPEEITCDMPGWRYGAGLAIGIMTIAWFAYLALTRFLT